MAPRSTLVLSALLLSLALAGGCNSGQDVAARPPSDEPADVAGMYRVEGLTTVIGSDVSREIAGTVILAQEGDTYSATFNLETLYPGPDGALPAEVIGKGEGTIKGQDLEGTARTQIVASRIPGLDSRFTLVPPAFGVRIVSNARGSIADDGSIKLVIESRGVEGESYIPTRTTMEGIRIDPDS